MRVPPSASIAAARLDRFLAREEVVWLSTVRPDGTPHLVPIWFTWDGTSLLVLSKPHAQKVRNLRANPVAMLALGEPDEDFDVALAEATVELVDGPLTVLPPGHLEKYGARMAALGLSAAEFLSTYSQLLRITPTRTLQWHGRTTPRSVLELAAAATPPGHRPVPAVRWRTDFGRALRSLFGPPPAVSPTNAVAS